MLLSLKHNQRKRKGKSCSFIHATRAYSALHWSGNRQTQFEMFLQQQKYSCLPTSLSVPQWHHFLSQTHPNHLYLPHVSNSGPIPSDGSEPQSCPSQSKCSFLLPSSQVLSAGLSRQSSRDWVTFSSTPLAPNFRPPGVGGYSPSVLYLSD